MFYSRWLVQSGRDDSSCNELFLPFLPFRNCLSITSLSKMIKLRLLAGIFHVPSCLVLARRRHLVVHELVLKRTLLLVLLVEIRCQALFEEVGRQVFLECLEPSSHSLHNPLLQDSFFVLRKRKV